MGDANVQLNIRLNIKKLYKKLLDVLYPRGIVCIRCGKELGEDNRELELCEQCMAYLPINLDTGDAEQSAKGYFDALYYNLKYKDFARDVVISYKDQNKYWLYYNMAKLMRIPEEQVDYVTYVPCHKRAKRRRGYDHAELLAKEVAKNIGVPCIKALERVRQSGDSSTKNKQERQFSVIGAFSVAKNIKIDTLSGKTVLLVDDLFTTGSTANECSRMLKELGCYAVYVSVFARA